MLSMAPVGSAGGAAKYFAADNYYTLEESAEESLWYGEGAELLGLAPGADSAAQAETSAAATDAGETTAPQTDPDEQAAIIVEEGEAGETGEGATVANEPLSDMPAEPTLDSSPALIEAPGEDDAMFDPEAAKGLSDRLASEGLSDTLPGTSALADDDTAFGPERADGFPAGTRAPSPTHADPPNAGKLPLSNPTGKVDATTFENILNGKLPDGTQVGKPGDRQLGMDLTFSMPKSASLIAYVGGDKRVLEAHMGAVKTAMRWVEANLAETRVRDNQGQHPVRTGNLVYALFQHDTSRALDPQGHVHAVIANLTRLPNGEWRSLHNGQIWRNNTVTSSIYHAAFRDALEKLGYGIVLHGKHGTFEIAGVPRTVRDAFSQRREAILAKGAEIGIATPQGLREVTKNSRDAKIAVSDREALRDSWKARADALGWNPSIVIDAANARADHQPSLIERSVSAVDFAIREARLFVTSQLHEPADPLIDRGFQKLRLSPDQARAQLAVASAIRILGQREAAFEVNQIIKTALDLGLKGVTPERISVRLGQLIKSNQVVPGASQNRDGLVTTREAINTEIAILAEIDKGKGRTDSVFTSEEALRRIAIAAGDRALNDGQMAAAVSILSTRDRIMAVQGDAGTGKSTMLRPVADILKFEGKKVLGLAFQTKVAAALRDETGIAAATVAQFLIDHARALQGDKAAIAASRAALAGSFIFLDEASMISNDQMVGLNRIANIAQVAKFQVIGDRKQLLPIDGGKSFALGQAGGMATSYMTENLRQKTPELRTAVALSKAGHTGQALRLLGSNIHEGPERNEAAADWWLGLSPDDRERTALFTSGKQARADINLRVQDGLKDEGTLKGEGAVLRVIEAVDRTREEMRYAKSYAPGMTLEVWKRVAAIGLTRGEYRVARVFANGKIELARGSKRFTFKPELLPPGSKDDPLRLVVMKDVKIYKGEKVRWTANDKTREIRNGTIGKILGIADGTVTIEQSDKSVLVLQPGDPMLRRIDLAYALNMHMAQGMTTDSGALVMGSEERFLANQRLAHVGLTRVREELHLFTDDKEKLIRQIERASGDKTSALEVTGRIDVEGGPRTSGMSNDRDTPFYPGPVGDFALVSDKAPDSRLDQLYPGLAAPEKGPTERAPPQNLVPEKVKGLEL
jgi:conjugative relaxase-like TrwC/TraI family protein